MRGLFFKIFAIFWVAQSFIFMITAALIVSQHFPNGNTVADALDSHLRNAAETAIADYNRGGCAAFARNAARYEPYGAALMNVRGATVCATADAPPMAGLRPHLADRIDGRGMNGQFFWMVPVTAADGSRLEYVWTAPPPRRRAPPHRWQLWRFAMPQVPVAIAVGGVTTFLLVLLISRPLVRLRRAARQLAAGKLDVRVEQTPRQAAKSKSDEFQGLVLDFNHMAERLESMVDAQKLLLRDVSHELRSPLARLSVALELVRDDAAPELAMHLARIEREANKLNQLIGQLLTLSAMEARDGAGPFEIISLNAVCEQILPDAEYEAQQRPCRVELVESGELRIRGNADLLYRAIENVVRNAIRYTAADTTVEVRLYRTEVEGVARATIAIEDRGPGVPEGELSEIFRPFYRVDRARSADTGGFGVGLAITERAVRLHGGTLQASNRAGGGTSVTMTFPLA